jgi:hypothetical protein
VRGHSGWRFEYKGWDHKDSADLAWEEVRSGATRNNPFPEERKDRLDYELLRKLGVNRNATIINCDPLLFYQLVLPLVGDPSKNKLEGDLEDPRMPFYYSKVENYIAKYAACLGLGGSYVGTPLRLPRFKSS